MILSTLIQKGGLVRLMTATPATVATHQAEAPGSVAKFATVAVAGKKEPVPSVLVTCNRCEYFTPDKIGDGAGIGRCRHRIEWTLEASGRMPLYRYANRHCDRFIMR